MGISGLLPALKPIQVTKHLSEYKGKTIAVDAYVWLHKGVFACATDLATGKSTNKYVDYAMHRIRLLRHYGVEPYVVFDGGPLPAKKGTEKERKETREKNLARGNAFAAQGNHSQARDCYIKCVDVTPQMAYQLIKALKAENVSYVVAPYEADAQLAYLARKGLVDGILTEDSDLLVFGCQTVLFKFDPVSCTVVSISRSDFSSICDLNASGISLLGWSDVQFRAMAILSGCDYLPSIQGIGLKTACTLLRKWKTVEQVLKIMTLEGKRKIPDRYLESFRMAEKCFLHQRVYCPLQQRLIHLSEVLDPNWDEESDKYVGGDVDMLLAQKIAVGDVDPVTLLPMQDINPHFIPRALKPLPFVVNTPKQPSMNKGKAPEKPVSGGILSFFGPQPIIPPRENSLSAHKNAIKVRTTGRASGKRTLAHVLDHELEQRKRSKHRDSAPAQITQSKFFIPDSPPSRTRSLGSISSLVSEKENISIAREDFDREVDTVENISMDAQCSSQIDLGVEIEEIGNEVEQELGYNSPTPSLSREVEDLSSPPNIENTPSGRHTKRRRRASLTDVDFGAEPFSSPLSRFSNRNTCSPVPSPGGFSQSAEFLSPVKTYDGGEVLCEATPERKIVQNYSGPDLRDFEDIDFSDEDTRKKNISSTILASGSSRRTVHELQEPEVTDVDAFAEQHVMRTNAVAKGWTARWSLTADGKSRKFVGSKAMKSERGKMNMTPSGRNSPLNTPKSERPNKSERRGLQEKALMKPRRSLTLFKTELASFAYGTKTDELIPVGLRTDPKNNISTFEY